MENVTQAFVRKYDRSMTNGPMDGKDRRTDGQTKLFIELHVRNYRQGQLPHIPSCVKVGTGSDREVDREVHLGTWAEQCII